MSSTPTDSPGGTAAPPQPPTIPVHKQVDNRERGEYQFQQYFCSHKADNFEDFIEILPPLARSLHRSLFTAPGPLKKFQNVLAVLVVALETVETISLMSGSSDVHTSIEKELQGCDETLLALRKFKRQHHLNSQPQVDQKFTDEALNELTEIQERLNSYANVLDTHNTNIIRYVSNCRFNKQWN